MILPLTNLPKNESTRIFISGILLNLINNPNFINCRCATTSTGGGTRAQGDQHTHENHKAGRAREEISTRMKSIRRR